MSAIWNGRCIQSEQNSAAQSTTSLTCAFPSNPTTGSLLIAAIAWFGHASPAPTITDTLGNAWSHIGAITNGMNHGIDLYYCANCTGGGADTVTFASAQSIYKSLTIAEYPGLSTTALDTSSTGTGTSTTPSSGNMTPVASQDLLIGIASQGSGSTTAPVPVNWTGRQIQPNNSTSVDLYFEDRCNFDTNAIAATFTLGGSSAWLCIGAAFKNMGPAVASGGGAGFEAAGMNGGLNG